MKFSPSDQFVFIEGLIKTVQEVLSLGVKQLWLKNDHTTPPCRTKVKNECRCNSIPYLCTFMRFWMRIRLKLFYIYGSEKCFKKTWRGLHHTFKV